LVLVAAYSGLRAGELSALRGKHVDLLHRTITVVEQVQSISGQQVVSMPKSAAGRRSVSLHGVVAVALEEHLTAYAAPGPEGLVFPAPEGGFMRLENFRKRAWTPATVAAGVAPLRLHDLRHTCASLAIAAGADVKVLQRMLGHASAALTLDSDGHLLPGQAQSWLTASMRWPDQRCLRRCRPPSRSLNRARTRASSGRADPVGMPQRP
jgi:integrase